MKHIETSPSADMVRLYVNVQFQVKPLSQVQVQVKPIFFLQNEPPPQGVYQVWRI